MQQLFFKGIVHAIWSDHLIEKFHKRFNAAEIMKENNRIQHFFLDEKQQYLFNGISEKV